jgi:hypothetical protein
MARMREAQRDHLEHIGQVAAESTSQHHAAILRNYQEHVALEQAGLWREIFNRKMIVEHPVYKTDIYGPVEIHDGADAVGKFYESLKDGVAVLVDERIAVADWGFASYSDCVEFAAGSTLGARGIEVNDPDITYKLTTPQVMFWMYDENAILLGEHLYMINQTSVVEADPADTLTKELILEQCRPFYEREQVGSAHT